MPDSGRSLLYDVVTDYNKGRLEILKAYYPTAHKYNNKILFTTTSGLPVMQATKTIAERVQEIVGKIDVQIRVLRVSHIETHNFRGDYA